MGDISGLKKVMKDITISKAFNTWIEGISKDGKYRIQLVVYKDKGEIDGIDGGRISKLWMTPINGNFNDTVANYDRGWDIKPKDPKVKQIISNINKVLK